MMGQELRLALYEIRKILLQHRRNSRVQFLSLGRSKHAIGGVLHHRVLEQVG